MLSRRWGRRFLFGGWFTQGLGLGNEPRHLQGTPLCMVGCAWAESSGWGVPLQYLQVIPEGEDVYDWCLTQAEIQGNINKVNGEPS